MRKSATTDYSAFWDHADQVFRTRAPVFFSSLNPPATEDAVRAVEAVIGYRLHEDIRQAYLRHDGTAYPCWPSFFDLIAGWAPLSVALETWHLHAQATVDFRSTNSAEDEAACYGGDPAIQAVHWIPEHFPIGFSGTSQSVSADHSPGEAGVVGQLFSCDFVDRYLAAPSFNTHLLTILGHLESGVIVCTDAAGFIHAATGKRINQFWPELVI